MKKIVVFVLIFFPILVSANEFKEVVPDIYVEELEDFIGYSKFSELVDAIVEGGIPKSDKIIEKIVNFLIGEVKNNIGYITAIIGFAMMSACVKGIVIKEAKGPDDLLFLIIYCVIAVFSLGILKNCVKTARELSEEIDGFVKMTIPAYIGIVSALIPVKNPANLEGIFILMINAVSFFAGRIMINMFFYIGVLYIINYMSHEIHVLKLIELVKQIMFWVLGFILTVFAGITALSGINQIAVSQSGMRALKYTVGHAIPIVGGFLADSSDLIFASAKIFKNAFGTAGIIIIFAICLIPVIKLFVSGILLKAAAGLTEPFCDKRICDCVSALGQTVIHIMVCVILNSLMFVLSFATLLLAGMGG